MGYSLGGINWDATTLGKILTKYQDLFGNSC